MIKEPILHYGNMYSTDKYAKMRIRKYASIIKDNLKEGDSVLDIGCYTAELPDFLPSGIFYFGVDFDDEAVRVAKSSGLNVVKVNLEEEMINFNQKFDLIIAAEILEHLKDPTRMMRQIKGLLKNKGMVIISLPNENTLYHRFMSLFGLGIDMCAFQLYKHLHLPTIRQSTDFVSQYLKIIRKEYYINPGGRGSRFEKFGLFLELIPDKIWEGLAYAFPGCFARGIIIVATQC